MNRRPLGAALLALAVLVGGGCGSSASGPIARTPRAYHPERFPDIPLPPGFMLAPGHDQLAVAMAGGVVRRFDVWMVAKPRQPDPLRGAALLGWYDERLPGLGWTPAAVSASEHRFRRTWQEGVGEELRVVLGGDDAVEFHLAPWTPPAP